MSTAVSYLPSALSQATDADIKRVFDKQLPTALRLRTSTADERIEKLKRLKAAVMAFAPRFYEAMYKDFKKSPTEVELFEILPVTMECNYLIGKVKGWMKPQRVWPTMLMGGTRAWVQHEPRGRCLVIAPWNYPVNLMFVPLAQAIAAGNTVILKPSEMTPHTAAVMAAMIKETFSEDEIALFEGDVPVSTALLNLPFDHIFFTGSPAVGKLVMAAAAKHLTSVTLELGGKSPTIVDESADLKTAADTIMWGKFSNSGQTCIAPDHLYVHESVKAQFIENAKAALTRFYGASATERQTCTSLSHVVNERHTKRVAGLLADAKAQGAQVVCGGEVDEKDQWVSPTLITQAPKAARVMQEEIFGPILPIIGYTDIGQVINEVNAGPKPLALYIWSKNESTVQRVLKNTSSGGACINHCMVQYLHGNLPFGGVNNSGIGSSHGPWGFKAFSHERAVVRTQIMMARLFFAPYPSWLIKVVKFIQKFV